MDMSALGMPPSVTLLLIQASCEIKDSVDEAIEQECKIKSLPFILFVVLAQGPSTLIKLSENLQCSKQEVSRLVKRAQAYNWIHVTASETDKREKYISLSETGLSLLGIGANLHMSLESKIQASLGDQRFGVLKQLLAEVYECLAIKKT